MPGWETLFGLMFGSVGALITARRPDNRVGWLLLGLGLTSALIGVINWYPVLSDSRAAPLPLAETLRWLGAWVWIPFATAGTTILPLVFPDGHLPSPGWRPAVALAGLSSLVLIGAVISLIEPFGTSPPQALISAQPDRAPQLPRRRSFSAEFDQGARRRADSSRRAPRMMIRSGHSAPSSGMATSRPDTWTTPISPKIATPHSGQVLRTPRA